MVFDEWVTVATADYAEIVDRLNLFLHPPKNSLLANHIPPHTFVGNLENMTPGDCILLMGINPKLSNKEKYQRVNIDLPIRCLEDFRRSGDVSSLKEWYQFQNDYFMRDERNKSHFTKIGNWIGPRWFSETYGPTKSSIASQRTCHRHLIEVDVLPYYSNKSSFNTERLKLLALNDDAIKNHMRMIESIIERIQPRWIQVNGKSNWKLIEALYADDPLQILNYGNHKGTEVKVGHALVHGKRIPLLMHKFLGQMGCINGQEDRDAVWKAWERQNTDL